MGNLSTSDEIRRVIGEAGVRMIPVPTPFIVGPVNVYLIEDEPLTLIDTGPNVPESLAGLEEGLAKYGYQVEDLERIVISHQHSDHLGLLATLVERSGAEVACLDLLAPHIEEYRAGILADREVMIDLLSVSGFPPDALKELSERDETDRWTIYGSGAKVERRVADGGYLEFASRRLRLQHSPGHSPSDTLFIDEDRGIVFTADHLLRDTPVFLLYHSPLGGRSGEQNNGRPLPVVNYLKSLERTRDLDGAIALPGHGEPFVDLGSVIAKRQEFHAGMVERIAPLIDGPPVSIFELAQEVSPRFVRERIAFAHGTVLGHLDVLIRQGRAEEMYVDGDPTMRFQRVSD